MAPPLTARLRLSKVRRLSPAPKDLFAKKVFVVFARSADGAKLLRWGFAPGEESLVCSKSPRRLLTGVQFYWNEVDFTNIVPSSPHTSSRVFGYQPGTLCVRLAWRKRHARFESSGALAELPAVARTAVELHGCCARTSLAYAAERRSSANMLTA